MRRWLTDRVLWLALLCCGLAGGVYWAAMAPIAPAPVAQIAAPPPTHQSFVRAPTVKPPPALQQFAAISDRPLFSASRRPPPPPTPATAPAVVRPPPQPAPPAMAVSAMTLVGVITGPGERAALVKTPGAAKADRYLEGQEIGGWHIARILADRIVLTANTITEELKFPVNNSRAAIARPVPPGVSPVMPGPQRPGYVPSQPPIRLN